MPLPPSSEVSNPGVSSSAQERKQAIVHERMLRRFKVWLDDVLESEAPPQGLDLEILAQLQAEEDASDTESGAPQDDDYTVWSALVAMTEETRLQGRAFKQLHDDLPPVRDLATAVTTLLAGLDQERTKQEQDRLVQAGREVFKGVLDTVLDMRDRLERGLKTARLCLDQTPRSLAEAAPRRWWQRRPAPVAPAADPAGREAIEALIKGYQLALERMDESLARWHVKPLACLGQPFDPNAMKAVDLEERGDVTQGTVLDVYRTGYLWNKKVQRLAEVKVAKSNGQEVLHDEQ